MPVRPRNLGRGSLSLIVSEILLVESNDPM